MSGDIKRDIRYELGRIDDELRSMRGPINTPDNLRRADALNAQRGPLLTALAQLEVADATRAAAAAQKDAAEAQDRATAEQEREKSAADGAEFWFRRFMLSLQIGNGAAFVALAGGILQADNPAAAAAVAAKSFALFGGGLTLAGIIPLLLFFARRKRPKWWPFADDPDAPPLVQLIYYPTQWDGFWTVSAFWCAIISAGAFGGGLTTGVRGVTLLAQSKPPPAAQTKAVSPPTSPSGPAATSPTPSPPPETPAPPTRKSEPQGAASQPAAAGKGGHG